MNKPHYLIIGNSAAAVAAVEGIRSVDTERPITLVAREPYHTYSRPLISYLLGGQVDEVRMSYRPADFYKRYGIETMFGVEVSRVDAEARRVQTADGEAIEFEKLLIATGGRPIIPGDVPGADAEGVYTFTCWDDARRIKGYIERNGVTEAVVVGGGLIGLKSVEALAALGIRTSVIELADRILSATFDATASALAQSFLHKAGVQVRCGTTVTRVEQLGRKVSRVTLRDGGRISCGLVLFAIGVVPDTRIVEGTGVEVDRGILVNDAMETTAKGIHAAGDVAQALDLLNNVKRTIPIFPNAYRQGYIAGVNMAGEERKYEGGLAMNAVDICGLPTISVGTTDPGEDGYEILTALDEEAATYKKIVLKDNRIVGAIFLGQIDRAGIITGLIKQKTDVSSFKNMLLTDQFGLISLPEEYRKHMVSGGRVAL